MGIAIRNLQINKIGLNNRMVKDMKDFQELLAEARKCRPKRAAIAVAQDGGVLAAARECYEMGIAESVLVGDAAEISRIARERKIDISNFEVINEVEPEDAVRRAVQLVREDKADILVKGAIKSPVYLKGILDKNTGLRVGRGLSHVTVFEAKAYNRLMLMTDAGLNIMPTLEQKIVMVKNAVCVARSLKIPQPKVAVISGQELVNPDMPSTIDAAILSKMAERGQIKDCIIDGPLSLDLALSKEAALAKGVVSPVAGQADILVLPNIDAANVLYKSIGFLAGANIIGLIVGAKVPATLPSRADSHETKMASIAMAVLFASKEEEKLQLSPSAAHGETMKIAARS
ncbi:bifunctional enoyl-CoA hydratase/phosphate acetyltransferase [Thermincola potens]|nr:bifunctional enoyl-CoA hydratase/phosphate acetyltransferase [Thermincola potens]